MSAGSPVYDLSGTVLVVMLVAVCWSRYSGTVQLFRLSGHEEIAWLES